MSEPAGSGPAVSGRELGSLPVLVRALGQVKVATARANGEAGTLPAAVAAAVEQAAAEVAAGQVDPRELRADLLTGGGSIAVHVDVNEAIARRAGVGAEAVGASQSTADVCHTAHRLAVLEAGADLAAATVAAVAGLRAVADRLDGIDTLARTCLRDAMATPLSTVFAGSAAALARRHQSLEAALAPLHEVVLGTTVIGQGHGADPAYRATVVDHLAAVTGRPLTGHPAPASALQHGDDLAAVSSAIVGLSRPLLKLASDLRLLASGPRGGFGEVVLPHVMDGSTFFAGKSNPVVPETVIQACLQVRGLDLTVQLAADRAELYLNIHDGLMALAVLDAAALLTRSLHLLDHDVLADLAADEDRCRELASFAAPTRADDR